MVQQFYANSVHKEPSGYVHLAVENWVEIAEDCFDIGKLKSCLQAINYALISKPRRTAILDCRLARLLFALGCHAEAINLLEGSRRRTPDNPEIDITIMGFLLQMNGIEECLQELKLYVSKYDLCIVSAEIILDARLMGADDLVFIKHLRRRIIRAWPDHPLVPVRQRALTNAHATALKLTNLGKIPEAYSVIEHDAPPVDMDVLQQWRLFKGMLSELNSYSELKRPALTDIMSDEVTISKPGSRDTVLIIFGGLHGGVAMPPQLFDYAMAQEGWQCIYVSDFQRCGFLAGLNSIGKDFNDSMSYLSALDEIKQAKHVISIGISAGSIAAVRFGLLANADRIVCFSGVATLDDDQRTALGDNRQKSLTRRLEKLANPDDLNVATHLRKEALLPQIELIYGSEMKVDRKHAESLVEFRNVKLSPIAGLAKHDVLSELLVRGELLDVIRGISDE
jgi:hypothetical protein